MRRSFVFLALTAMLCLVGAGTLVVPAGAQTQVFSCTYNVAPTVIGSGGGTITVQGSAPGTSIVRIFAAGVLVATAAADPVTGFFSASFFVAATVEITVAVDDYPGTPVRWAESFAVACPPPARRVRARSCWPAWPP